MVKYIEYKLRHGKTINNFKNGNIPDRERLFLCSFIHLPFSPTGNNLAHSCI